MDWDASLCIHTARCIAAQPAVFDPRRKPWVDLKQGTLPDIAEAVRRCPTGALRYRSDEPVWPQREQAVLRRQPQQAAKLIS